MRRGLLLVRRWPFLYSTRLIVAATLHTSDYSSNLWQEVYYDSLPYLVLHPGCPCNDGHPRGYVLTGDRLFAIDSEYKSASPKSIKDLRFSKMVEAAEIEPRSK